MAYSVLDYLRLGNVHDIEYRLKNLEFLIKPWMAHYENIKRISEDPEFAASEVGKWKGMLDDLRVGMENCMTAIGMLNGSIEDDDEPELETPEEEDDEE